MTPPNLTDTEKDILLELTSVWNAWCKLPKRRPHDDDDFVSAIHVLQRLIALRVARRVDMDFWHQPK